jgi:predicted SAM-dependent methyltransferase
MIKVHLGAGKRQFGEDWISIDKADFPHIKYKDVTKLPFRNNEVSLCYASHLLAYFDRQEIVPILNEWKRVLRPGGILRLATPDFDAIGNLIVLNKYSLDAFLGPLYGRMDCNDKTIYHKTVYNFESLKYLLEEVGFKNVKKYNWQDTEHAHIDDHSRAHFPNDPTAIQTGDFSNQTLISLNVECTK